MTENKPEGAPHREYSKRRLSDMILIAFHSACDQADIGTAWELLNALEFMMMRYPSLLGGKERRSRVSLVAAHERLWHVRHQVPAAMRVTRRRLNAPSGAPVRVLEDA